MRPQFKQTNGSFYIIKYVLFSKCLFVKNNISPDIRPVDEISYEFPQSKYEVVPKVPFRPIITRASCSGVSVLLTNVVLDISKNVFSRIYIWSPPIDVDGKWLPVKKYIKEGLKVDTEKENCFFEEFIPEELEKVIETQHKITEYIKNK